MEDSTIVSPQNKPCAPTPRRSGFHTSLTLLISVNTRAHMAGVSRFPKTKDTLLYLEIIMEKNQDDPLRYLLLLRVDICDRHMYTMPCIPFRYTWKLQLNFSDGGVKSLGLVLCFFPAAFAVAAAAGVICYLAACDIT